MNREIKFRLWHKEEKRFLFQADRYDTFLTPSGRILLVDSFSDFSLCDITNSVVVQQYTGLKDKNGKDIYEGDIVKFTIINSSLNYKKDRIDVVRYRCGYFYPVPKEPYDYEEGCVNVGVIGNIFEHPELLK